MVIDETMVPWRGRLLFRQYNPGKTAKYGVKLFKLCSTNGFTYALSVYSGKSESNQSVGAAQKVCQELAANLYNEGRVLVVDNWYTSYELARYCLSHRTHLVGTLRSNKKMFPVDVLRPQKLKKGSVIAKEDQNGIVVLTWRDTREVRMLSTIHEPKMLSKSEYYCSRNAISQELSDENSLDGRNRKKPQVIHFYNKHKCGIDLSDQMSSYATSLRKGVKWHRKLATELLLGVSIVNSWIVYQAATRRKIQIRKYRMEIASHLLGIPCIRYVPVSHKQHFLEKQSDRKNCQSCYRRLVDSLGRDAARKKIQKTYFCCMNCEDRPFLCVVCFNEFHKKQ